MAESIAGAVARQDGRPGAVVHVTGAFHSDFGAGTAERVRRRLEGRRVAVVSMMPVENLDTIAPADTTASAPTISSTRSSKLPASRASPRPSSQRASGAARHSLSLGTRSRDKRPRTLTRLARSRSYRSRSGISAIT